MRSPALNPAALPRIDKTRFNLARVDLVDLKLVVKCTDSGTLSAAAKACHMSVSGASHKLHQLETTLGQRLFKRHRRGLEPTSAGYVVSRASFVILETIRAMADEVARVQADCPDVT